MRHKPLPGQRPLFGPPDEAQIIREVLSWPDGSLKRVGRAIGAELIRRKRPAPLALDVGLRMHGVGMSAIADR